MNKILTENNEAVGISGVGIDPETENEAID